MSYTDLFQRYGSPSKEAEIRIWGYLTAPEACASFDQVAQYDKRAAQLIAECKHLVTQLIDYRQALAARYNALATMPSHDSLTLQRYVNYSGRITYYVRHFRHYEDGTTVETETETFTGKERHKALARFDDLLKQYPGIEATRDIERKSWER